MIYAFCAIVGVLVLGFTLQPLFQQSNESIYIDNLGETELESLLQKKEAIYENMKDLEFEWKMGKLSEEDFHKLRDEFKAEAAQVLDRIDFIEHSEDYNALVERELAAKRQSRIH
ncbi:MAG: hypothetical protein PHX83_02330 [Acidobacteriia bacterium]|nr:hypothetical protein [Terriglobia bacterium]